MSGTIWQMKKYVVQINEGLHEHRKVALNEPVAFLHIVTVVLQSVSAGAYYFVSYKGFNICILYTYASVFMVISCLLDILLCCIICHIIYESGRIE